MKFHNAIVRVRSVAVSTMGVQAILLVMALVGSVGAQQAPTDSAVPSPNPRTDWFCEAGYGVFVHYLSGLQNDVEQLHSLGRETSWDECVADALSLSPNAGFQGPFDPPVP